MPPQRSPRNKRRWFWPLVLAVLAVLALLSIPSCAGRAEIATKADVAAAVKAIGDDVRSSTEQIVRTQAQAGRDLHQAILTSSETTTTTGMPWYGVAGIVLFGCASLVGLAYLRSRYGGRNGKKSKTVRSPSSGRSRFVEQPKKG